MSYHDRYQAALHAMQSGIAYLINLTPIGEPKHLRVGIDSAMVSDAAIVELLIAKGVFTRMEFTQALASAAEAEVKRYEAEIERLTGGVPVKLG